MFVKLDGQATEISDFISVELLLMLKGMSIIYFKKSIDAETIGEKSLVKNVGVEAEIVRIF